MQYTIYAITFHKPGHRWNGIVRYVGQTSRSIQHRWIGHCAHARFGKRTALAQAMRKHGPECFLPVALVRCRTRAEADATERRLIAEHATLVSMRRGGLNIAPGGEGVDYSDPVVRAKHKASLDDRWRAAQRERRINDDPAFVAKQRASLKRRWASADERARQGNVMRDVRHRNPEIFAAIARRLADRNRSLEARAITAARNRSPEMREGSRKRAAAMNANPKIRLRMTITRNRQSLAHYEATGQAEKAAATRERIAALEALLR